MAEELQQLLLDTLNAHSTIQDTRKLTIPGSSGLATSNEDQILVLGALNSLQSREVRILAIVNAANSYRVLQMVIYETHDDITHVPTEEGTSIVKNGSHEARVWSVLPMKAEGGPWSLDKVKAALAPLDADSIKNGQGRAFKSGWIAKDGEGLVKIVHLSV